MPLVSSLYTLDRSFKVSVLKSRLSERKATFSLSSDLLNIWSTIYPPDVYCMNLHARIILYAKAAWVNTDVTQPADLYLSVWLNLASVDCLKSMTFAWSDTTIMRIRFHHLVLYLFFYWSKLIQNDLRTQYPKAHGLIILFRL